MPALDRRRLVVVTIVVVVPTVVVVIIIVLVVIIVTVIVPARAGLVRPGTAIVIVIGDKDRDLVSDNWLARQRFDIERHAEAGAGHKQRQGGGSGLEISSHGLSFGCSRAQSSSSDELDDEFELEFDEELLLELDDELLLEFEELFEFELDELLELELDEPLELELLLELEFEFEFEFELEFELLELPDQVLLRWS